ncbi:hydroxysteroid dehydrogenase-like protein 2 [Clonorchis sinensis]|uniref:Hydroxysteroid dehydrogenase-like protein 2 n=1 Tax=Clonorchis sinensis TaxID=79923 RepID=G7YAV8_CLOSI|nr:hydroxysteroid dehydrogenase-like protein 2 [Clonorchis sinensis]
MFQSQKSGFIVQCRYWLGEYGLLAKECEFAVLPVACWYEFLTLFMNTNFGEIQQSSGRTGDVGQTALIADSMAGFTFCHASSTCSLLVQYRSKDTKSPGRKRQLLIERSNSQSMKSDDAELSGFVLYTMPVGVYWTALIQGVMTNRHVVQHTTAVAQDTSRIVSRAMTTDKYKRSYLEWSSGCHRYGALLSRLCCPQRWQIMMSTRTEASTGFIQLSAIINDMIILRLFENNIIREGMPNGCSNRLFSLPGPMPLLEALWKDPRTVIKIPRRCRLRQKAREMHIHLGLKSCLLRQLREIHSRVENVTIQMNVGGSRAHNNSRAQPFVTGIYCGKNKPNDVQHLMSDTVTELTDVSMTPHTHSSKLAVKFPFSGSLICFLHLRKGDYPGQCGKIVDEMGTRKKKFSVIGIRPQEALSVISASHIQSMTTPESSRYTHRPTGPPVSSILPEVPWKSRFKFVVLCLRTLLPKEGSSVHQVRQVSVAEEYRADLARKLLEIHSHVDGKDCLEVEWSQVKEAMLSAFRTVCPGHLIRLNEYCTSPRSADLIAVRKAIPANRDYDGVRRFLKHPIIRSLRNNIERWWISKVQVMEEAFTVGNSLALFQLIRSTGQKKVDVMETICEKDGTAIHSLNRRFERLKEADRHRKEYYKKSHGIPGSSVFVYHFRLRASLPIYIWRRSLSLLLLMFIFSVSRVAFNKIYDSTLQSLSDYHIAEQCPKVEKLGGKALPCAVDIRFEDQVQAAVDNAVKVFGGLDILVNNASAIQLTNTASTSMKSYDLLNTVNARDTHPCGIKLVPGYVGGIVNFETTKPSNYLLFLHNTIGPWDHIASIWLAFGRSELVSRII